VRLLSLIPASGIAADRAPGAGSSGAIGEQRREEEEEEEGGGGGGQQC